MPPLHRAVALAKMDRVAVLVAEDLEFNVTRAREILLDVHLAVAERRQRLRTRELERAREIVLVLRDAHPLPATAGRRLDDDREADLARETDRFLRILHRSRRSRDDRHADVGHCLTSGGLVAHDPNLLGRRTDEGDVRRRARLGELRVLGEKPIAGMDRVRPGDLGGCDQAGNAEIRFPRRRGPDADVVVGESHVQRLAVGFRIDGDRLNAELAARANDAQRDLPAIRDQDFLEHDAAQGAQGAQGAKGAQRRRDATENPRAPRAP